MSVNLDEIIDFPRDVITKLSESQSIIGLLADNPNATIEDIENSDGDLKYIYDYEYVDNTVEEIASFICVDTNIPRVENEKIKDVKLYIYIISHKEHMKLNSKIFKGIKGNRRDNLIKQINLILNGAEDFGIGTLELTGVSIINTPLKFTGKVITYTVPTFNKKGNIV